MLCVPSIFLPLVVAVGVALAGGCATGGVNPAGSQPPNDSAMYVVRLGQDTSYLQWIVRSGHNVRMDIVERIPRVRLLRTMLTQNPDGSVASLERRAYLPAQSNPAIVERVVVRVVGDSTIIETTGSGVATRHAARGRGHIVVTPFLAASYPVIAPYAPTRAGDSILTQAFSADFGDRVVTIKRVATDSFTIYSDILGTIRMRLDERGRGESFSGVGSSINTEGARAPWLPVDSVLLAFAARERATGVVGAASPRDTARANLSGANLVVDYGRPAKRGRQVFGGVVPWNRVWRTGANLATHFTTDRTLRFGDAELPPGRYTMWTLPAESGWMFIVNNQTNQWGTDHDPRFDRFRVPMQVTSLNAPVERFTILVEPVSGNAAGGVIRLRWDTLEASVPFTVIR